MDLSCLRQMADTEWRLEPRGTMLVPAVLYGDASLLADMDDKVLEQISNVACLPGIVEAAYTMPDAHWGYGFPIGGVAAFDPEHGGIVSAGGVVSLTNHESSPSRGPLHLSDRQASLALRGAGSRDCRL